MLSSQFYSGGKISNWQITIMQVLAAYEGKSYCWFSTFQMLKAHLNMKLWEINEKSR